jgi:hypothetical protein
MSDLPPLKLSDTKREAIFQAINEANDIYGPLQPGDITTDDIMARYGVGRVKARQMMEILVDQQPWKYQVLMVILPNSYHNRPGYVLREIASIPSETSPESNQRPSSEPPES